MPRFAVGSSFVRNGADKKRLVFGDPGPATNDDAKRVSFFQTFADASAPFLLGTAVRRPDGWRFIPNVCGRKSSRKFHATLEKCIPRWVGYPDRCESKIFPGR